MAEYRYTVLFEAPRQILTCWRAPSEAGMEGVD